MKPWRAFLFLISAAPWAAGCGSNPPALSEQQETAIQFNQRAHAAFKQGDYHEALAQYQKALSVHRSMENMDGIATELINLSTVHRRLGDKANAQNVLDQILTGPLSFAPPAKAEAAYRKATFYLEDGNAADALAWSDKAIEFCRGCAAEGRLYNLKARMLLSELNFQDAAKQARRALALHKNSGDKVEEANSLRLIADAALKTEDFKTAQQFYDDALRLDKETGAAAKISLDLMGLGHSLVQQGRGAEATDFFRRAYSVSEGMGDEAGMRAAEKALGE